ncbi:MAG: TCR/Tet family MFS transporter [Phycisphaerales bacterium]|nr:TCR/Tet family MFS transporter [Phycisphaerales bacterium]
MTKRGPAVGFIFVTLLLDVLGFGLLIPVAPKLVEQLQGGTESEGAHAYWLLTVTYAAMQFVFAPVLGALSDVVGRRPVLLCSLLGSGLDYFAMALSPSLSWLFVTRAINGISGASMTAASAYIADVTPPEKRAGAFGMIGAAFGLGFVLGPLLGGWLGQKNIHLPFYVAGVVTLLNWLYGLLVVPESLPRERRSAFSLARVNPVATIPTLARYPLVAKLSVALTLVNIAQFGLHVTWVLAMSHRFGWTTFQVGLSLFIVGIGAAVVQGGLARKIVPVVGERRSLLVSLMLAVAAFTGYGLATQGWMIYAIVAVASLGGIGMPAAQSLITRAVKPEEQGAVQGALSSLQSGAQIVGPAICGSAFAYFISERAPFKLAGAPFFIGAALTLAGLGVAALALRGHRPGGAVAGPAEPAAAGARS